MSGDHNQYQKPEPLPEKSKGALSHEEMMRRVMEALPTMPIRAVVEPTQKKPQREWQGLTKEELDALVEEHSGWPVEMVGHVLICAAEDKLKEKNT